MILVAEYSDCDITAKQIVLLHTLLINCHPNSLPKRKSNLYTTQKYFCFKILFNPSPPIFDPNLPLPKSKKKLLKHDFIAK